MTIAKDRLVIFKGRIYDKTQNIFPFYSGNQKTIDQENLLIIIAENKYEYATILNRFMGTNFDPDNGKYDREGYYKNDFNDRIEELRINLEQKFGLTLINSNDKDVKHDWHDKISLISMDTRAVYVIQKEQ